ncbi:hypothetical protein [Arenimonas sp.]|uniref:hypothetical protein n=1 Tax=Arenimonas sp. TaxID=1872635 RepID=UPI0035B4A3E2
MKHIPLGLALAAALAVPAAHADDLLPSPPAESALRAAFDADLNAAAGSTAKKGKVTNALVGDADSFGREVQWLGLLSAALDLQPNCSPSAPGCVPLAPSPNLTQFDLPDLAVLTLPAGSSHSLVCHLQTPAGGVNFANPTTARVRYEFEAFAVYRIESRVLRGLSHPGTGQPYNGVIEIPIAAALAEGYAEPGDYLTQSFGGTRACIGGLVSRQVLMSNFGLSEREATQFFREPIQVRMGIRGQARFADMAYLRIGTRLTGD